MCRFGWNSNSTKHKICKATFILKIQKTLDWRIREQILLKFGTYETAMRFSSEGHNLRIQLTKTNFIHPELKRQRISSMLPGKCCNTGINIPVSRYIEQGGFLEIQQFFKKYHAYHANRRFITLFTKLSHWYPCLWGERRTNFARIAIRLPTDATLYFVYLFPLFLPYMFRALISPSSGVSQAVFLYTTIWFMWCLCCSSACACGLVCRGGSPVLVALRVHVDWFVVVVLLY